MANITTDEKRLWLRRRWSEVPATYATLLLAIQTAAWASADSVKAGAVSSVTAGDRQTSFSNSENGSTPQEMAALSGEMLDLYDISRTTLIAAGIGSPTDLQIFTEMLDRLKAVRESTNSYVGLRIGA